MSVSGSRPLACRWWFMELKAPWTPSQFRSHQSVSRHKWDISRSAEICSPNVSDRMGGSKAFPGRPTARAISGYSRSRKSLPKSPFLTPGWPLASYSISSSCRCTLGLGKIFRIRCRKTLAKFLVMNMWKLFTPLYSETMILSGTTSPFCTTAMPLPFLSIMIRACEGRLLPRTCLSSSTVDPLGSHTMKEPEKDLTLVFWHVARIRT
mmetsp:Transcript_1006/g.2686  ORF Transcript_1006/g.2686 Transcript_1006/m.2686 type:complete len:208 (+) Transcript_1006:53-676(+)